MSSEFQDIQCISNPDVEFLDNSSYSFCERQSGTYSFTRVRRVPTPIPLAPVVVDLEVPQEDRYYTIQVGIKMKMDEKHDQKRTIVNAKFPPRWALIYCISLNVQFRFG